MTHRTRLAAIALAGTVLSAAVAPAAFAGTVEVVGLDEDEMLKLRSGPGTGYKVIVGLPNGTQLRTHGCDRVGGTSWCKVSLRQARGLRGYVSGHYLKDR